MHRRRPTARTARPRGSGAGHGAPAGDRAGVRGEAPPKAVLDDVVVMVLAGGVGERLYPLTRERAKPAVYFGGPYRIIDFMLSNCLNSGLRKVFIALQYK